MPPPPRRRGGGIEQHLVGLRQIGAQEEGSAVAELELRHLKLGALAGDSRPALAPVELKRLALGKAQRDLVAKMPASNDAQYGPPSITPNSRFFPYGKVFYTWVNIRCKTSLGWGCG